MSCELGQINATDFLSDDEIVEFFIMIDPTFCMDNLPSYIRLASAEMIACKTNTQWEQSSSVLYVDGKRESCVISPRVPIIELTDITIIYSNERTKSLTLTGEDREVEWACDTGVIRLIKPNFHQIETIADIDDLNTLNFFPPGLNNVKLTGVFGTVATGMLKLLQLLLIGKSLQMIDAETYAFGKVKEKIGRYEYQLGSASKSSMIMSFDDYINFLFDLLPNTEGLYIGSV